MIDTAVKGALLRPAVRVALDGSVDHETMHGRRGKPPRHRTQNINVLHFICETAK